MTLQLPSPGWQSPGLASPRSTPRLLKAPWIVALLVCAATLLLPSAAAGQEPTETELRVVTTESPPWAVYEGPNLTGAFVEIWKAVAESLDLDYELVATDSFSELLEEIAEGDADVAAYPITPTAERAPDMDFSVPVVVSGTRIAAKRKPPTSASLLGALFSSRILRLLLYGVAIVAVVAHLVWYFERGRRGIADAYRDGIFDAFWFALVTITTVGYGDFVPESRRGKVLAMVWMIASLFALGGFIAEVSNTLGSEVVTRDVSSADDLSGKQVGAVEASVHQTFAEKHGATVIEVDSQEELYSQLEAETVDAIVTNPFSISVHEAERGEPPLASVDVLFNKFSETLALSEGHPLKEDIDRALLELVDSGAVDSILERWTGES